MSELIKNPLFEAHFDQIEKRKAAQVGTSLTLDQSNPDQVAESINMGKELGVPAQAVMGAPEMFKTQLGQKRNSTALSNAPKMSDWLGADPVNGSLAKDDLDNLTWFERKWAKTPDTQFGRGVKTGVLGVGQVGTGAAAIVPQATRNRSMDNLGAFEKVGSLDPSMTRYEVAEVIGVDPQSTAASMAHGFLVADADGRQRMIDGMVSRIISSEDTIGFLSEQIKGFSEQMQGTQGRAVDFTSIEDVADLGDWIAFNSGQSIPFLAAIIGAGALGGPAAVGSTGYAMGVGDINAEMIEQGITDRPDVALAGGIPYAALEALGPAAAPFRKVGSQVLTDVASGYLKRVGREVPKQAVEEFINEFGQEVIKDISVGAGGGEAVELNDETLLRWFNSGMAGAVGGATFAPVTAYQKRLDQDMDRADAAGLTGSAIDEMDAMAAASKLKARSPDKFLEALNASGAGDAALYVPAADLQEYFQGQGFVLDDKMLAAWGVEPADFAEKVASGGDLAIPASNYAARISGTDAAGWFRENSTFQMGEMSLSEAAEFNASVQEEQQAAFDAAQDEQAQLDSERASDVQIYDSVFSQLRSAGRSPDVAKNEAEVWRGFWGAMGARYGADPLDLAQSMGVTIQGPQTPEVARRRDRVDAMLNTLRSKGPDALQPRGMGVLDFIRSKGGIADRGGDIESMDVPKGVIAETRSQILDRESQPSMGGMSRQGSGMGLDDIGRALIDEGYLPEYMGGNNVNADGTVVDEAAIALEAIGEAMSGRDRFPEGQGPDQDLVDLYEALNAQQIDLGLSNDEIAAALQGGQEGGQGGQTYDQSPDLSALPLATVEGFETGKPAEMPYVHNTNSATKNMGLPQAGDAFMRDIEPSGKYITPDDNPSAAALDGYEKGVAKFESPLVIEHLQGQWKKPLSEAFGATGKELSKAIMAAGFDAVVTVDQSKRGAFAFETVDLTTFDEGRALYQSGPEQPLAVAHNISARGLQIADEMGGLAAPSLGVVRADIGPLDGFGEITLVAGPDLADPRNSGVRSFNADVYSVRQPRALTEVSRKNKQAMEKKLDAAAVELGRSYFEIDQNDIERYGLAHLADQDEVKLAYLRAKGIPLKVKMKKKPAVPAKLKKMLSGDIYSVRQDPEQMAAVAEQFTAEAQELVDKFPDKFPDVQSTRFFDDDGQPNNNLIRNLIDKVNQAKRGPEVDRYETGTALRKKVEGSEKAKSDFLAWIEDEFGGLTGDLFFETESGRKKPYNLDELVRAMKGKVRDAEGFNYGVGNIRSNMAREFKSITEVKDARSDIVTKAEFEAVKDEVGKEFDALLERLKPHLHGSDGFGFYNRASDFIGDFAKGNMREWAGDNMVQPLTPELSKDIRSFLNKLSVLPTEYFEVKMQRAVDFSEFSIALVPKNASKETVALLKKNGLQVKRYDSSKEGSRAEAMAALNPRVFFQADAEFGAYREAKAEADRLLDAVKSGGAKLKLPVFGDVRKKRKALAEAITANDGGIELTNGNGLYAAVTKSQAGGDGWRVTVFNDSGFLGHTEHKEKLGAVTQALEEGYTTEAEGALRNAMKARTFFQKDQALDAEAIVSSYARGEITPAQARAKLKKEGWSVGPDGFRRPNDPIELIGPDGYRFETYGQGARGSIVLPRGGLSEGQTVINLFESADLSTFLHESGHFFLEAFTALAESPGAPAAMQDDLAVIRKFLKIEDGATPTRDQHETWARGFEAYIMEGKAPSLELASAFSRFKSWLTRIYKTARGLNVTINNDIRAVMDRMLATDEQIAAMRDDMNLNPLFTDAGAAGMSDVDFATYQRMAQRSAEQAEARLMKTTMAKIRRETLEWYKAEKKAVTAEVEDQANRMPVYRLTEWLGSGRWLGEGDPDIEDLRMDRDVLSEQFTPGILQELSKQRLGGKRAIYVKGGARPELVAEFFGFGAVEDMIGALQNAGKRKDFIAAEVDRIMDERHGDPLNDGSIEEAAAMAVHSEQQAATVATEVRTIAKRLGRPTGNIKAKFYRQRAKAMLGRMSVREASRSASFLQAERAAARAAERAFARVARGSKGSNAALSEAMQAKEQQLLNSYLYREAMEFEKTLNRGRERMRSYEKKSVREKIGGSTVDPVTGDLVPGYIEQIDQLLERFDFRKRTERDVRRSETLRAYVDRMIADGRGGELAIDDRLMNEAMSKHYTRLSVDELLGLFDTIANIDHTGRFKKTLQDRKRQRDLDEVASGVAGAVRKRFGSGKSDKQTGKGKNFLNLLWRVDTIAATIDQEEMGAFYDAVKRGLDEGAAMEQKMNVESATKISEMFEVYTAKEKADFNTAKAVPGGNGKTWTKQQIISLALNMGNANNIQRVLDPRVHPDIRLTQRQLDATLATLDKRDWDFVQSVWDYLETFGGDLAEVHERRTGFKMKRVEAQGFSNAHGSYRGGYYPIAYDPKKSKAAMKDEQSAFDKFLSAGRGATATVADGMTQSRQNTGGGRALNLDLSVMLKHVRDTTRVIAMSEAVDNSARVLNHNDVITAFQDAGQTNMLQTLELFLQDVATGPVYNDDPINGLARIIKNNFTMSRLAFNVKTVALQMTGLGQSAAVVGKLNMLKGFNEYRKRPNEIAREVMAKSPFMAERQTTFQKDIYDQANDLKLSSPLSKRSTKVKNEVSAWGFAPMIKVQFYSVDMPTWVAAYQAELQKNGGDEDLAVHYADRMVDRSQGGGLMTDRNALERGTVGRNMRQSDFVRLWTTLGGYMVTKMNRGYLTSQSGMRNFSEANTPAGKAAAAAGAATDLALLYLFEAGMMGLAYSLLADGEDEDEVKAFMVRETFGAAFGGIPFVRDTVSSFNGYGAGGVLASALETPANVWLQIEQGDNDRALRRSVGDAVGLMTGLPTTQTMRVLEEVIEGSDGSVAEALLGRNPLSP